MNLFRAIAFALFVVAAVLAFLVKGVELRALIGITDAGLAALALEGMGVHIG